MKLKTLCILAFSPILLLGQEKNSLDSNPFFQGYILGLSTRLDRDESQTQQENAPKVLITATEDFKCRKGIAKLLEPYVSFNQDLNKYRHFRNASEYSRNAADNQKWERSGYSYGKISAVNMLVPTILESKLQKKLHQIFASPVCFSQTIHRSSQFDFKTIGSRFDVDFIVSPFEVFIENKGQDYYCELSVEFYSVQGDSLLFGKKITGIGSSPEESLNIAAAQCSNSAFASLIRLKPIKEVGMFSMKRSKYLLDTYPIEKDPILVQQFKKDSVGKGYYSHIISEDKTKIMAHCIEKYQPNLYNGLLNKYYRKLFADLDVENFKDPNVYDYKGYTLLCQKFKGKWYYQPINEYYFHANDSNSAHLLFHSKFQNLNFFLPNSANEDPDFWKEQWFKIVDISEFENPSGFLGEQQGGLLHPRELNKYRPHHGIPTFLADQRIWDFRMKRFQIAQKNRENYWEILFDDLIHDRTNEVYYIDNNPLLLAITSYDLDKFIIPIYYEDRAHKEYLKFYVWFKDEPKELYEWTKIKDEVYYNKSGSKLKVINQRLKKITPHNFLVDGINDPEFWDEMVIKKKNGNYKYLEKLEM